MKKIDPRIGKVLATRRQVATAIKKLAEKLNKKFAGKKPIMIGIFSGAVPFFAKLSVSLDFDHEYEFIKCESYSGTKRVKDVEIFWFKKRYLAVRDIILIDDVFDTGHTVTAVIKMLKAWHAKSITTVSLCDKPDAREVRFTPDYTCFKFSKNDFLVGLGLDWNGTLRNLPYIGVLKKELQG